MSITHPIIAVTGSSGAGTTGVKLAFEQIFAKEGIRAAIVEGDSFHRYDRREMEIARAAARRMQSMNNMKQLSLALLNYHDTYGQLPPAVVTDANGKPLYSGRVLLLPFFEQAPLWLTVACAAFHAALRPPSPRFPRACASHTRFAEPAVGIADGDVVKP